jgi:hypothetical protein
VSELLSVSRIDHSADPHCRYCDNNTPPPTPSAAQMPGRPLGR